MHPALYAVPVMTLVLVLATPAYAQTTHEILIPSGAADPSSPRFWYDVSTGNPTGDITIYAGDWVLWNNADTEPHTVTSVTQSGEEDGVFDSGNIGIAEKHSMQFNEIGDFHYYCIPHPWMTGVIHVVQNPGSVKTLNHVAFGHGPDGQGFEVRYILDASLDGAVQVDSDSGTLTFAIQDEVDAGKITLVLPNDLMLDPGAVWVDGVMTDFTADANERETALTIPLEKGAREVAVMGSHVVPEFGFMAQLVLVAGIVSALFLARSGLSSTLLARG